MTKIVIIVEGGCVSEVRSNTPSVGCEVEILDLDSQEDNCTKDIETAVDAAEVEYPFILA